jgi:AcrR family transcriptional regulator
MPRPRLHSVDAILDAAEQLVGGGGPSALTLRSLALATGAPAGTLTHAFGSRDGLVAQLWLRAAQRFLDRQRTRIDSELASSAPDFATRATVAAALAPIALVTECPGAAAVLLGYRREDLLGADVPDALADDLYALDQRFVALLVQLAEALWQRRDATAVEVVTVCVVDLPTGLLRRHLRGEVPPDTARHLQAAVEGVLALGAPPHRKAAPRAHSRP